MIEASKEGKLQWRMLNVLASNGRGYAKNEDDRAIFIAETFGALAAPLSQKSNLEMRTRYLEAASALRSLAKWDNRKTSLLKDIVRQELEKFKHESEWLDAWRSYLPSRRRIPAGQFHSEPWA